MPEPTDESVERRLTEYFDRIGLTRREGDSRSVVAT
jgi:hypothetical protein